MLNLNIEMYDSNSLSKLILADESDYDNVRVKNVSMEITPPNFPKINVPFVEKQINVYNAKHLNIYCEKEVQLPDGIYTVKYSIFPNIDNFIEKKFFRLELLKCKYGKTFLNLHKDMCCPDLKKSMADIERVWQLIIGTEAAANDCDFVTAYSFYNKACKLLDAIKDCKC